MVKAAATLKEKFQAAKAKTSAPKPAPKPAAGAKKAY